MTEEDTHIDRCRFRTDFVKLETDVKKSLKLTSWHQSSLFDRTSKRLISALMPIIQKAEKQGRKTISSILRTGDGFDTAYQVKENA